MQPGIGVFLKGPSAQKFTTAKIVGRGRPPLSAIQPSVDKNVRVVEDLAAAVLVNDDHIGAQQPSIGTQQDSNIAKTTLTPANKKTHIQGALQQHTQDVEETPSHRENVPWPQVLLGSCPCPLGVPVAHCSLLLFG